MRNEKNKDTKTINCTLPRKKNVEVRFYNFIFIFFLFITIIIIILIFLNCFLYYCFHMMRKLITL